MLIAKSPAALDARWLDKLNTGILDTGNAMSDAETIAFSRAADKQQLKTTPTPAPKEREKSLPGSGPKTCGVKSIKRI